MVFILMYKFSKRLSLLFSKNHIMPNNTTKVAIVGTAGRGDAGKRMSKPLFDLMVSTAQSLIREELGSSPVHLISGGAAWSGMYSTYIIDILHFEYRF